MEKEIKYRCWIDRYKEFKYWGFIGNSFIGAPTGSGLSIEECKELSQQFTGLLDKNGKEIYEGDIIEFHANYSSQERVGYKQGEIKYTTTTMRFDIYVEGFELPFDCLNEADEWYYKREIIGNIHQLPTLNLEK